MKNVDPEALHIIQYDSKLQDNSEEAVTLEDWMLISITVASLPSPSGALRSKWELAKAGQICFVDFKLLT